MAGSCFADAFLQELGLKAEYFNRFFSQGYEGFTDVAMITSKDLEHLNIVNDDHKIAILEAVDKLPVRSWLEEYKLKAYEDRILEENIKTIKCLKELKITDSLLDRLDIMVPGHRKRFTTSVQTLQTITAVHGEQESRGPFHPDAVAVGYWTRPQCLERLEHDFLCVKGCFKSRIEDDKQSELLEFLLDSASDVVTARREIIEGMGLEYIKDVDSHGVHTVAKKPLYKGQLKLGNSRWIDVEIQLEDYESVGSTVMKEFVHFINGTFHQWLPKPQPSASS